LILAYLASSQGTSPSDGPAYSLILASLASSQGTSPSGEQKRKKTEKKRSLRRSLFFCLSFMRGEIVSGHH
ncbi:MAG: hypothetical protein Q4B73_02025, partial [Lachnospiraceae bacterium]|nr:hypothetical protein [Lachnospiraceae bacterium]